MTEEKQKYTDKKTGEEVTRFNYNFQKKEMNRKEIYTDVKEFNLLKEHLKPLNVTPSEFITNIIKTTNRSIEESKQGEDIKVCFGIEFPENQENKEEDKSKD